MAPWLAPSRVRNSQHSQAHSCNQHFCQDSCPLLHQHSRNSMAIHCCEAHMALDLKQKGSLSDAPCVPSVVHLVVCAQKVGTDSWPASWQHAASFCAYVSCAI